MSNSAVIKHKDIISRLNRINGHLLKIINMLENERECTEVAQQLQAVENALNGAKKSLIHKHIDICLENALEKNTIPAKSILQEFREISKYL